MSLRYGFGLHSIGGNPKNREKLDERYKKLTEEQLAFYNQDLPFLMMAWGIGHLSEKTIAEIVVREFESGIGTGMLDHKDLTPEKLKETLMPFVGFETNVTFETYREWVERQTSQGKRKSSFTTGKQIDEAWDEYRRDMNLIFG